MSAIAREPDGKSRIQIETFQEVFNRMEKYELGDRITWSSIIEYFTKRGRPLTLTEKEEILRQDKLQDEAIKKKEEDEKEEEEQFYDDLKKSGEKNSFKDDDPLAENFFNPFKKELKEEIKYYETKGETDHSKGRGVRFEDANIMKDSLNDRDTHYRGGRSYSRLREKEDLTQIELQNKDFKQFEKTFKKRSKSTTKEYKITVPRSFKFEKRAQFKPKTIREYKVQQMIEEKRIDQEMSFQQFRASRPPPEVMIPQYKNIVEKEAKRRSEVKKNSEAMTKKNEKLFEFYKREERKKKLKEELKKEEKEFKYKFKARNVPIDSATEKMKDPKTEKYLREQRIKERAKKLYEESKLPPNMHKNEKRMTQRKEERMKELEKELFEFDRRPKRREKPNFQKLQKQFINKIDQKKKEFKPVKVKPFNLTEAKEVLEEIEEVREDPKAFMKVLASAVMKTSKKPVPVQTTKKMNDIIERKKKAEEEEKSLKEA